MEYISVAKFKVVNVFDVFNRGKVLSGNIIEGVINNGNHFYLTIEGDELRYVIDSIDTFRTKSRANIGLLIKQEKNPLLSNLENITRQSITILSNS
jgi:hypothetical protein